MDEKKEKSEKDKKEKRKPGERAGVNGNLIIAKGFPPGAASKGAKAANKKRAERRKAQELMREILSMSTTVDSAELGTLEQAAEQLAKDQGGTISVYQALLMAQAARALQGDTAAATYTRDTAGDKPTDKQEITGTITEGDKALCAAVAARLDEQKTHKE